MTRSLPVIPSWHRYAVGLVCAVVILSASVLNPGDGAPVTLFGIGITVYLHAIAYGGLAGAVGYALLAADGRALLIAAAVSALYGAGIELLQGVLAYRTMSAFDVVVNTGGAAAGAMLWWLIAPWFSAER